MAGDWIKWEKGLAEKDEILGIARRLKISRFEAAGRCMAVWEWADSNLDLSRNCPGGNGTKAFLDERAGVPGFADAMEFEKWLEVHNDGSVTFPNADEHLTQSAKTRGVASKRKRKYRRSFGTKGGTKHGTQCGTEHGTKVGTREEKRRVTDNTSALSVEPAKKPRKRTARDDLFDAVVAEWWDSPDTLTKQDSSRIGKLVTALVAKQAKPADVAAMADAYRKQKPKWDCTPEAVMKHWDALKRGLNNEENWRTDIGSDKRYEHLLEGDQARPA